MKSRSDLFKFFVLLFKTTDTQYVLLMTALWTKFLKLLVLFNNVIFTLFYCVTRFIFTEYASNDREVGIAETPVTVPFSGDKIIVKIECCCKDSAMLSADGEVTVWGETWNGGSPATPRLVNLRQVVDISIIENRLYAFGKNYDGRCGQVSTSDFIEEPVEVKNLENIRIKQISAGWSHCLIKCVKY